MEILAKFDKLLHFKDIVPCIHTIYILLVTGGSLIIGWFLITWFKTYRKINKKRKETNIRKLHLFQKLKGMKTPFNNMEHICNLSGKEILKKLKSKEFFPVDVLEAYQANALVKNHALNFIADIIYDADVSSLMIDPDNEQDLMGFPLSISDTLCVQKYDCSFGLSRELMRPNLKDSGIVQVLREHGAIPTLITNIGQGNLVSDTSNPIFGRTWHPLKTKFSPGGNAGGLATSLASGASLIGIGTDKSGCLRIPASHCGLFALKPTSSRICNRGVKSIGVQQSIIGNSIGAMARNIDDLVTLFRSMVSESAFQLDPSCPPIGFRTDLFKGNGRNLKIGYYVDICDSRVPATPAVERAVLLAKKALERAGHQLVEYQLPEVEQIVNKVYTRIAYSDGGRSIVDDILNEGPVDGSVKPLLFWLRVPKLCKKLLSRIVNMFYEPGGQRLIALNGATSVYNLWQLRDSVMRYRDQVISELQAEGLDGLIGPVLPTVATQTKWGCCGIMNNNEYAVLYNILDFVAGTVPVTTVTRDDINKLLQGYAKRSKSCRRISQIQSDSLDLPVGVQCVALPWCEEVALRIMHDIVENL